MKDHINMVKARTRLLMGKDMSGNANKAFVFLSHLVLRLRLRQDKRVPTAATDGITLMYNPDFVAKLSVPETVFLVAHEVMHCVWEHHARLQNRDHKAWNVACDLAINPILKDMGLDMPKGGLLDDKYRGMSADRIYAQIPRIKIKLPSGAGSGEVHKTGSLTEGGAAGKPQVDKDGNVTFPGGGTPVPDWTDLAAAAATAAAKHAGDLPAGLDRFVENLVNPIVDWRAKLARFVTPDMEDHSWTRPNRRFIGQRLYLPSRYSETVGPLVVAIDTSGSIDQEQLTLFMSEVGFILNRMRPKEVTIIFCDHAVASHATFTQHELPIPAQRMPTPRGGGGTSFVPVFELVKEKNLEPMALIYLTDMEGYFPDDPPNYPVMWFDIDGGHSAPFGEVTEMRLD